MSREPKQLYSCDYHQWKKWERLFECDALQQRYFEHEFSGIDFSGKRLLEIGFGDGSLLRWIPISLPASEEALIPGNRVSLRPPLFDWPHPGSGLAEYGYSPHRN